MERERQQTDGNGSGIIKLYGNGVVILARYHFSNFTFYIGFVIIIIFIIIKIFYLGQIKSFRGCQYTPPT